MTIRDVRCGECATEMALPFSACGLVIGKGGTIQKEIQEQTGGIFVGVGVLEIRLSSAWCCEVD